VSETKVDALMSGRKKSPTTFLGDSAGSWTRWGLGLTIVGAVGYFGIHAQVERNAEGIQDIKAELVETRKHFRALENRLASIDVYHAGMDERSKMEDRLVKPFTDALKAFTDSLPRGRRR